MNSSQLLIKILKSTFTETIIDLDLKSDEFYILLKEARDQQLDALIISYLSNYSNCDAVDGFTREKNNSFMRILRNKSRYRGIDIISRILNENGIKYVYMKGPCYRNVYLDKNTRLMSDFDILIYKEDLERSLALFETIGYKVDKNKENDYNLYLKHESFLPVELHFNLTLNNELFFQNEFLGEMLESRIYFIENGIEVYTPSYECTIVYSLMHMMKHLYSTGFGLRQFYDFVIFVKTHLNEINIDKTLNHIINYKLKKFYDSMVFLANEDFSIDIGLDTMTYPIKEISMASEKLLNQMISSGVYGHKYKSNDEMSVIKNYYGSNLKSLMNKIRLLFPGFRNLNSRYRYARKVPVLLPIAWLHRIIYVIVHVDLSIHNILNPDDEVILKIEKKKEIIEYFMEN